MAILSPAKEHAKSKIRDLVQNYLVNKDKLRHERESDTRAKFIDRMFEALGWDLFGERILDEVEREQPVRTKDSRKKRADYTFRINGLTRFVVEAKALGEDLDDSEFTKQAINYAYNKACFWAVLTNFERLYLFYVDRKGGLSFYKIHLAELDRFDSNFETLWYLSRENVSKGLLEEEARRRGISAERVPIDQQLLADFKTWRELLSNDIRKRYGKEYDSYTTDEIVQRIVDRLIFIRKAEDSKLEEPKLLPIARRGDHIYSQVKSVFAEFRDKYDSKLFGEDNRDLHESDRIDLSDRTLERVISNMYKPTGGQVSYDFSQIDSDILGSIYEQYLAYVLAQTPKRMKLEGGIAHRKEQGIYYTPTPIVEFILKNTLGRFFSTRSVAEVGRVRVLDPACGSGSFLIKAFDLLNGFLQKTSDALAQTQLDPTGNLPFTARAQILRNNIFGVDLDARAVEISQLNLLMKIAERGNRLPVLQRNIQCGNSLVEDSKIAGDSAFAWNDRFPNVMKEKGFDVIIGNPPYFNVKADSELKRLADYPLLSKGVVNIAALFVKRSVDLLRPGGYLGLIIPKSFAYVDSWQPLRKFLANNCKVLQVVDVSRAFKEVLLEQVIVIAKKDQPSESDLVAVTSEFGLPSETTSSITNSNIISGEGISFSSSSAEKEIFRKVGDGSILLGNISENFRGIGAQKYVTSQSADSERVISGKDIQRYAIRDYDNYYVGKKNLALFDKVDRVRQPKIMAQNIVAHIRDHIKITATYDSRGLLDLDTVNNILITSAEYLPKYVLALLNSRLISYYTYKFIYSGAIRTMHFDGNYSGKIPIKKATLETQAEYTKQVDSLLELNERLVKMTKKQTAEADRIKDKIARLQEDLDAKIFNQYGLNEVQKEEVTKSFD